MYLGRVIGTVVSTSKNEHLVGMKLLVVEKLTERLEREGTSEVAVDSVGAGTRRDCHCLQGQLRALCVRQG